jgi:nucleosome binding factor SPN SPT16 subunit
MFASVQALRKEWVDAVKKEALKSSLVAQESLKVIKDAPVRLRDIMCRPALSKGKRVLGTLIAHANGFRYITVDRAYVDVIYANIKACVLQRADKRSNFVIIHLELYNPILISNKKSSYVQFYVELGTGAHDLDNNFYGDDDEARQEEEDRQKRKKWNERFANFARSTENQWEEQNPDLKVEFDIPDRKKAFQGVPNKTVVELVPTDHCLVALEDYPPTVVAKSEIELISLERVNFNLREFDLVVIYKEFTRSVTTISSIPTTYLDMLKQWLGDSNILYIESVNNTNWKTVLEDIRKDVRGFYEEGGWLNYFVAEDDEDEEIAAVAEASGSDFQLSEVEDESSSDDFESDGSSASDDDDSFSSAGEDEDSEGADWDELERRAAQEDRRRGDDDEPAKKPKKRSK